MSNDLVYLTYYSIKIRKIMTNETVVSDSSVMDILSVIVLAYLSIHPIPIPEQ